MGYDYDVAIIGSGFGGSVSALRLVEKGYRVAVLEQGKRVEPEDMEAASRSVRRLMWMPGLGLKGFFYQRNFQHVSIVGGVGVGGGSLVYAAVLLRPSDEFFADPTWSRLGVDWKGELSEHYDTASRMLGVAQNPRLAQMDDYLRETAERMGAGDSFGPTPNGIHFGTPEVNVPDPYFEGQGPARDGCHLCGECLTGCVHGAKNTLDHNYLHLAEGLGATILPQRRVTSIQPDDGAGYVLQSRSTAGGGRLPPLSAKKVILAAGVLGTLELLFRCKLVTRTLPALSDQLGTLVRTNSESIVASLAKDPQLDLTQGTAISSHFYPDSHTHITQNRFPKGYGFMRWYTVPLVDHPSPWRRTLLSLGKMLLHPLRVLKGWFARNWHRRVAVLTVMQNLDNRIAFRFPRALGTLFVGRRLKTRRVPGREAPTNLPVANRAASVLAEVMDGVAVNIGSESLLNMSTTAHILGGCHMGSSAADGVIDTDHQVFGYRGLYVVDGAAVTANVGVNPSLTIVALAERAMARIPRKERAAEKEKA